MKSLVVFYSRTGNTKKIAEEIGKSLQCDVEGLHDEKKRTGVLGYLRSGRDAMTKQKTAINDVQHQLKEYDCIIIGTPIWAWTMWAPVRTFLEQYKSECRNVAFFTISDSTPGDQTFSQMEDVCGKHPIATLSVTKKELSANSFQALIKGIPRPSRTKTETAFFLLICTFIFTEIVTEDISSPSRYHPSSTNRSVHKLTVVDHRLFFDRDGR